MPDIDRDEYGLAKVHIREYLGYVWVCLADEPPSFEEDVMGAIEECLGRVHATTLPTSVSAAVLSTIDGSEGLDLIPSVSADQDRRYYAITVKLTAFVNLVPDHVIIHRMFPITADHTIVECHWLYMPSLVESGKDVTASAELPCKPTRL